MVGMRSSSPYWAPPPPSKTTCLGNSARVASHSAKVPTGISVASVPAPVPTPKSPLKNYPLEKAVVAYVLGFFKFDENVRLYRRNVGDTGVVDDNTGKKRYIRFGEKGQADIWGVIRYVHCPECGAVAERGVHVEIECKRYRGRLRPEQKEFLKEMKKLGAVTLVARPEPAPNDPNGFESIGNKLERLPYRLCHECETTRLERLQKRVLLKANANPCGQSLRNQTQEHKMKEMPL